MKEISGRVKVTNICNTIPQLQQKGLQSTASALQARETGNHLAFCVFCKENHYSASCGKVTGASERRDSLR